MNFLFLIISFLFLVFSHQTLISLLRLLLPSQWLRTIYFLFFLPGIILHEFSHYFLATILLVPTGEINLFPDEQKLAGVQVAKTDPVRQFLVGIAPTIIGTLVILTILLFPLNLSLDKPIFSHVQRLLLSVKDGKNLFWFYLVFVINNTMFASKTDQRSWFGLIVLLFCFGSFFYLFRLFSWLSFLLEKFNPAAKLIAVAYTLTLLINLIFIVPLIIIRLLLKNSGQNSV